MENNFINDLLRTKHPKLLEKEASIQREKSIEILNIRLDKNKSVHDMAKILDMSVKEYLEYEFGDTNHDIAEYEKIIDILKLED